jgi:hypothetical protein
MFRGITASLITGMFLFGSLPSTSNYTLNSFSFGSGGGTNVSSSNYSLEGITGEANGSNASTANAGTNPGFIQTQQEGEPTITLTNTSNNYDRLHFVLTPPVDTACSNTSVLYAIEVSTSSTFSSISYVQPDDTLGATLVYPTDYQTCAAWGGTTGQYVIGLSNSTTYYMKATAIFGKYTQSPYGPAASATTSGQQLTYCLYTGATCGSGTNSISMGNMAPQTVTTSSANIGVNFATNANSGGNVYIYSQNGGMKSTAASYLINTATANLNAATEGYGAQVTSVTPGTGSALTSQAPYNGTGNNVGALNKTISTLFSTAGPVTGASGSLAIKVLPSSTTPEASDYSDVLTVVASANY